MITKLLASKRISCALLKVFLEWYHLKDVDGFAYVELVINLRTSYKIIAGEFEIPENKFDRVKQALIKVFGAESVTTKSAYELLCS